MKYKKIIILLIFFGNNVHSQVFDAQIAGYIDEVNIDTLVMLVREISGEDPAMVNNVEVLITNRQTQEGKEMAANYIQQKLESYDLLVENQSYSSTGRNIIAVQQGIVNPENVYIICGHYDSVAEYCADDNGSGLSATLEASRILSAYNFENTIVYAFWDEEEIDFEGSTYYVQNALDNNIIIKGVLNFETMAYDSNEDMLFDIHADSNVPQSIDLANIIISIIDLYNLSLIAEVNNEGEMTSDQFAFWENGVSAITCGGALFAGGGDLNPYYHTDGDRIDKFSLPYFHEMSKLATASISTLAVPVMSTATNNLRSIAPSEIVTYPNPVSNDLKIELHLEKPETIQIQINDLYGRCLSFIDFNTLPRGDNLISVPYRDITTDISIVQILEGGKVVKTLKVIKDSTRTK